MAGYSALPVGIVEFSLLLRLQICVCVGEDCLRMSVFCGGCGCGGVCR